MFYFQILLLLMLGFLAPFIILKRKIYNLEADMKIVKVDIASIKEDIKFIKDHVFPSKLLGGRRKGF
ncbi:hypothetical protein A3K63_03085 [Candidatus Micrarchaeota archaeon RBG_16_49_10]|nr:MAG: hypothetical protein A3K63_03085 [Candidatus Micrarchaeota archaeon RBG_16_49_10]